MIVLHKKIHTVLAYFKCIYGSKARFLYNLFSQGESLLLAELAHGVLPTSLDVLTTHLVSSPLRGAYL